MQKLKGLFTWLIAVIERLGLDRAWLAYGAMLFIQSLYLPIIQTNDAEANVLKGYTMHVFLLGCAVLLQAQFWSFLPRKNGLRKWGEPILAALVQFALLAIYISNHISLSFLFAPLQIDVVAVYLENPLPAFEAAQLSPTLIGIGVAGLLAAIIAINILVFRRLGGEPRASVPGLLAMGAAGGLYFSYFPQIDNFEFLHKLDVQTARRLAPPGSMTFIGERPKPRYAALPTQVEPRPLVIIVVDALRADAMEIYGNPTENTPFLARLQREGKLRAIPNAQSVCGLSYCGILGIISSRYWDQTISPPVTIPDVLAENGYRNHVLLTGQHMRFYGLRRHYGPDIDFLREGLTASGTELNDDRFILRWLDELGTVEGNRNFFYFHLMGVHSLGTRPPGESIEIRDIDRLDAMAELGDPYSRHLQRYHDGLRNTDQRIEEILGWLERQGQLEEALVLITADHGEVLGEMDRKGHGGPLILPLTNVPIIAIGKGVNDWPERPVSSTIDVAPTLLRAINARIPVQFSGVPLQDRTTRCAVESADSQDRLVIGEIDGEPWRLWTRRSDGQQFLEPGRAAYDPVNTVKTMEQRRIADALRKCREID